MTDRRLKLSYSAVSMYLTCPFKYYLSRRYAPLPKPEFVFGQKVHEVLARFYSNLRSRFVEDAAVYPLLMRHAQEVLGAEAASYAYLFRNAQKFELWRRRYMKLEPEAVEQKLESDELIGIPDVIFRCNGGGLCVVDWKSGGIPELARVQAFFYHALTGADYIIFYSLSRNTKKLFRADEVRSAAGLVEAVRRAIADGRFERRKGKHCSDCEYKLFCLIHPERRLRGVF